MRNLKALLFVLIMFAATGSRADDLQQREIALQKKQLAEARKQLADEKISRLVYETQLEVAALRGFQVKDIVKYQPLTKAKLNQLLDVGLEKQFPGDLMAHYVWLHQLFSAMPANFDMVDYMKQLIDEQVAGLYDPLSQVLFVRTDFNLQAPMGRMILAHEICHALQDQNTPLVEMGVEDPNDPDRGLAALSLAEGDATLLMSEHLTRYGSPMGLLGQLPSMMAMDQQKLYSAPMAIQRSLMFPYLEGARFFQELDGRTRKHPKYDDSAQIGGDRYIKWRQEVFADPPESTEQILHCEKYLKREIPVPVEFPANLTSDLRSSSSVILGEFGMEVMLETLIGAQRARAAAAGWNGDRALIGWTKSGRGDTNETSPTTTLYWKSHWDTAKDAEEFVEALHDAMQTRYAGTLKWNKIDDANRQGARGPGADIHIDRPESDVVVFRGEWKSLP